MSFFSKISCYRGSDPLRCVHFRYKTLNVGRVVDRHLAVAVRIAYNNVLKGALVHIGAFGEQIKRPALVVIVACLTDIVDAVARRNGGMGVFRVVSERETS